MKEFVVFDLDGTLSSAKHRMHLLPSRENRDDTSAWNAFNMAAGDDTPRYDNIDVLNALYHCYDIVILTGRSDIAKDVTEKWLKRHKVFYDKLIMRESTDYRKDIEFKEDELRKLDLKDILCCFDDLEHVAKHIRSLGVTCHLVTHYDHEC